MENFIKKRKLLLIELRRLNNFFILILSFLIYTTGFAQGIEISDEQSMRTDYSYEIIGKLDGKILFFKEESSDFILQAFDDKMKVVKENNIDLDKSYLKYIGTTIGRKDFTLLFSFRKLGSRLVSIK